MFLLQLIMGSNFPCVNQALVRKPLPTFADPRSGTAFRAAVVHQGKPIAMPIHPDNFSNGRNGRNTVKLPTFERVLSLHSCRKRQTADAMHYGFPFLPGLRDDKSVALTVNSGKYVPASWKPMISNISSNADDMAILSLNANL